MSQERILLMGPPGTGKTYGWMCIAAANPERQFFAVDSDDAVGRMAKKPLANVHPVVAFEWEDMQTALDSFKPTENDFIVFDMYSAAWDAVQRYYSTQVFGKSVDAYFLEARQAQKKGSPFDGRTDWSVINRIYNAMAMKLLRSPANLILVTPVEAISADEKDGGILSTFGAYGVKPRAQKHTAHLVHTVLLLGKTRTGEYTMTTIKDRGRKELEKAKVTNLYKDYMIPIAGWSA